MAVGDEILESFDDMIRRVEFRYGIEKIKVVVIEDIPQLTISFTETKPVKFGPFPKEASFTVPVWLMKVLKAKGYVVVHRDEKMDDVLQPSSDKNLVPIPGFFYNKTIDWLDTVERLTEKGMVSDQMGKRLRSRFLSFFDIRLKQILNSLSLPMSSLAKILTQEEQVVIRHVHGLIAAWEKAVFKRGAR
ncbi:MAG: hypothetical protein JW839_10215 [Candidatus Lokiarchaeota archaeon]|nr:hypothetical protein [Candidatus Lokiarchaeota archaeon]